MRGEIPQEASGEACETRGRPCRLVGPFGGAGGGALATVGPLRRAWGVGAEGWQKGDIGRRAEVRPESTLEAVLQGAAAA